jgi:hypothetical protein
MVLENVRRKLCVFLSSFTSYRHQLALWTVCLSLLCMLKNFFIFFIAVNEFKAPFKRERKSTQVWTCVSFEHLRWLAVTCGEATCYKLARACDLFEWYKRKLPHVTTSKLALTCVLVWTGLNWKHYKKRKKKQRRIFGKKVFLQKADTREKRLRMLVVCMQMNRIRHLAIVHICKCYFLSHLLQQWSLQNAKT